MDNVRDPTLGGKDLTEEKRSKSRSNFWCAIVYPESAPEDWKKRLDKEHIKAIVSPLHSPDSDPETSYEKKKHYHVMLIFDSVKSRSQALEIFENVFAAGFTRYLVIPGSKVGMLKYFCHIGSFSKEQLNTSDVICFGGVDYLEEISEDRSDYLALMDIVDWIHQNHCCSFVKFLKYCQYNNLEWFRIASKKCTLFVTSVISSERNYDKDILEEKRVRQDS